MQTETTFNIEALPVKITYVGETRRDTWDCDQWRVELSNKHGMWSTDYFTGTGLRKEVKGPRALYIKTIKTVGNKWVAAEPVKPTIADVLYSLFSDAQASEYNFSDWCDAYGYSDDSIKALNTYKQCLDIATALRKYFSPDERKHIQAIIQDM